MRGGWAREAAGWLGALAISIVAGGQVAASARSPLLFRDADSLVVAMLARSLLEGQPQDWALSTVLFLPETAIFTMLDAALPLGVDAVLAVNAVVNLVALYGALRVAAGRRSPGRAPVVWSLLALAAFGAIAATETSASRDSLELASLMLTTTYYSGTVVGVVLTIGLVRRILENERDSPWLVVALAAAAALSALSNPIYVAWAVVPLIVMLGFGVIRGGARGRMLLLLAVLVGGCALGLFARIPFGAWIANSGVGYAQPERWMDSLQYCSGLLVVRVSTPLGLIGVLLVVALTILAVRRSVRAPSAAQRLVATSGWMLPLLVTVGAIALGTHAARYLQPVVFAPVLALVAVTDGVVVARRVARASLAAASAVLLLGAGISIPRLHAAAQQPDADRACVVDWVNASGRTGAGQFWTVRLPKLHLEDAAQLVQVDHTLRGYAWLVNRSDFDVDEVTFLVEDAQTVPWRLPISAVPDGSVSCGRYTILDFGSTPLPLGPQRS